MRRIGICHSCGETKTVRDHHINGYKEENKDVVVPYCYSCDKKAHAKARKERRCTLPVEETNKLSIRSSVRRSTKTKMLSWETLLPNIQLFEKVYFNVNTGNVGITSYFHTNNGKKIFYVGEK